MSKKALLYIAIVIVLIATFAAAWSGQIRLTILLCGIEAILVRIPIKQYFSD